MPPEVELFDDWGAIERAAGATLDREACACLFDRLAWYRLIADHAPPPGRLLAARSKGAWLFLARDGKSASAFANWYTLRFSAVGADPVPIESLARALRRPAAGIARIELAPLDEADPLPAAFRAAGWLTFTRAATTRWAIDTKGMNFEAYWATRGSRLRNTAKRRAKAAGLDITIYTAFDADAWSAYEDIYSQSWKPTEGSPAFLRALAEQEGAAGTLRLGIACKEGRPIAAQLWLVEAGHATIHKLAYTEDMRDLSPGTILSVAMFRHALDVDKVDLIDFGTGDDGYKADWMDRTERLHRMVAFNPSSLAGLLGAARATASDLVRRLRLH